jgi:hypothetical protein
VRNRRSTIAIGVVTAGLLLTQQACTSVGRQTNGPIGFVSPSAPNEPSRVSQESAVKPADPILAGKRKVVIKPIPSFESILAVNAEGRLNPTDGEAEHGLFVLTPVGGRHQIKTAEAKPSCLGIKNNGTKSLTVVAAACDPAREGQLFRITKQKEGYAISNRDAFLQVFPSGLIAEELGDAP